MSTDEIRIGDLRPADRYRDFDSDEWRTVVKVGGHGDTTLLWLKDGTETAEDFEYVVEVQLPRATGEPWCNHDPARADRGHGDAVRVRRVAYPTSSL